MRRAGAIAYVPKDRELSSLVETVCGVAAIGFSKTRENHEAAHSLFFAAYNFVRVHSTLKQTPAMAAGLTDDVWSVRELLERAAALAA